VEDVEDLDVRKVNFGLLLEDSGENACAAESITAITTVKDRGRGIFIVVVLCPKGSDLAQ
jgi:hypothetical protein